MTSDQAEIQHVSDTAIWVAQYRALESERPDALFKDDLAKVLVGTRGAEIAGRMRATSRYVQWSVVIRTHVIDALIDKLVRDGVDMVVNLGAGLDTRPYRLALPASLRWVEVDYPSIIEHKERLLAAHAPKVKLERIALDLAIVDAREQLFARLGGEAKNVLVITEGVVPYLTEDQVASLAASLLFEKNFRYWIAEYFSASMYPHLQARERTQLMKHAPFRFYPADWRGFFRAQGWVVHEARYLAEEGMKLGRPMPVPWWARLLYRLTPKDKAAKYLRQMGYNVFTKA
jgi:methyltransferase (TIGR00027 family)